MTMKLMHDANSRTTAAITSAGLIFFYLAHHRPQVGHRQHHRPDAEGEHHHGEQPPAQIAAFDLRGRPGCGRPLQRRLLV